MFGSLFRRRDPAEASAPAPIAAGMAAAEATPHPILARMLSEASAIDTGNGFLRQHVERIRAPLADAPNDADAGAAIACDALIRLPAAQFGGRRIVIQPETWALRAAIEHGAVSGIAPGFSAPQMVAICRAMGELFQRDWDRLHDWPTCASILFRATLTAERCPRTPEVDRALRGLLDHVGTTPPIRGYRVEVATAVVAWLGLPRSASPTLTDLDADFARRAAMRERIAAVAGPDLSPLVDVLFDAQPGDSYKPAAFAKVPAVADFLGQPPAVLGAALSALFRIARDFPRPDYNNWGWISRRNGAFPVAAADGGYTERAFVELTALIPRRRIEIADAAMAELVRHAVTAARLPNPWRSRPFLNQALKVAADTDGAETRAALLWLAGRVAPPGQLNIPDDWTQPIHQALDDAAPDAALAVPELDLTMSASPFVTRSHPEIIKLVRHFQPPLDPRLHDPAHRDFLADLPVRVAEQLARMDLGSAAIAALREKLLASPKVQAAVADAERSFVEVAPRIARLHTDPRVAAAVDARFLEPLQAGMPVHLERVHWLSRPQLMRALDTLLEAREQIVTWLDAVAPFVTAYPAVAMSLDGLLHDIAGKSAPAAKWLATGAAALAKVPAADRVALLPRLINLARNDALAPPDSDHILRGLIWLAHVWDAASVARILCDLALGHCFQSVPGQGIRNEKLGNACLWALIHMPHGAGVPYLARLLTRVKYPKVRGRIDAALNEAAAKAGVARGVLNEMTVPDHGLNAAGELEFAVGGGRAIVALAGNRDTATRWFSPEGKTLKAANAAMKVDREAMRAVKAATAEIEADLATQVVRLQRLYLADRSWSLADWRRHYAGHPLMAGLTGRLLWWLEGDGERQAVLPLGGAFQDVNGRAVAPAAEGATIRLWHPIDAEPGEVQRWRDRVDALALVQPFAQIWREIYRLTDAERTTATYSNRWAGHILKQHQTMTLARLNGWTVTHRMWVDARNDEPWHLLLPRHRLVADYWVQGAGDRDDPEVTESSAFAYVSTDRLMFHRLAEGAVAKDSAHGPARGDAVALVDLPPLVLSEVMRHCDLFTAVASISSDPLWRDRGETAEHPSEWRRAATLYWQHQSLGPLTEAAKTRHALLARIVPRLAIADRCSLAEDGLLVRGTRHVYRIHPGSAAIFIEDQRRHLCIVPVSSGTREPDYYVPFDGDRTLSVIISKAMLLARDDKITDPTILSQL